MLDSRHPPKPKSTRRVNGANAFVPVFAASNIGATDTGYLS